MAPKLGWGPRTMMALRLPDELFADLTDIAKRKGIPRNEIVTEVLRSYVDYDRKQAE